MLYKMLAEHYEAEVELDEAIEIQAIPADMNFRQNADWLSGRYQELLKMKGWNTEAEQGASDMVELNTKMTQTPLSQTGP